MRELILQSGKGMNKEAPH